MSTSPAACTACDRSSPSSSILHDGRCVQLLWHGGKGLVRDPKTFKVQHQFELPEGCDQGWGLTHDGGEQLFLSDGAAAG